MARKKLTDERISMGIHLYSTTNMTYNDLSRIFGLHPARWCQLVTQGGYKKKSKIVHK